MIQDLKLLLIEDNDDDALLLERILKKDGFNLEIKRIQSEEEMLQAISEETFDIVISDYSLPKFSGPRAFEIFKTKKIDIPFILLSGNVGEDIAVSMMKAGVHDYIMKENLKRIIPAIKRELEESKVRREKKQAQQQLLASEARYRLMFEYNPLPSLLMDFETKQILQVNQAAVDLYGYTKEEFAELNLMDLKFEEDYKFFDRSLYDWDVEMHSMDYVRHKKKNGTDCFVIASSHNILIEDRKCRIIIITDLSEKKIAEENLRKSEEKFRALTENSFDGIMRFSPEIKYLYVNPIVEKMNGIPAEKYFGKTHKELGFPKDLAELWDREILKVIQTKVANRIEFQLPEGAWIDWLIIPEFNVNNEVEGVIASARDITERKKIEQVLKESEERYKAYVLHSSEGIARLELVPPIEINNLSRKDAEFIANNCFIAECNDVFAKFHGFQNALEMDGLKVADYYKGNIEELVGMIEQSFSSSFKVSDIVSKEKDVLGSDKYFTNNLFGIVENNKLLRVWCAKVDITERKVAEEALKESSEFQRKLIATLPDVIFTTDINGTILFANELGVINAGFGNANEVIGKNMLSFLLPEDREKAIANTIIMFEKNLGPIEYKAVRKDGAVRDFEINGDVLRNQEGKPYGMVYSCRDITERRRAEIALRDSEKRFRIAAERTGQLVYDWDLSSNDILWVGAIERVTGYTHDEFQNFNGTRWENSIHPDDLQKTKQALNYAFDTDSVFYCEYRFKIKNGSYIYTEDSGVYIKNEDGVNYRMIGTMKDISERKLAEQALIENEEKFRTIIEQASEGFILTDEEGKIIEWNHAMSIITGIQRNEVIDKLSWDVMMDFLTNSEKAAKIKESYKQKILDALAEKNTEVFYKPIDFEIFLQNSEVKHCQQVVFPIKTEKGLRIASMTRDITEQKKTQKIIQKYLHELEVKNAELERFTYTVSHDLKSPLITIKGYIGMLREDLGRQKYDRMDGDLTRIAKATEKMKMLLDDLLHLSRIGRILNPASEFCASVVAQEAVDLLDGVIQSKKIKVELQKDMPTINADKIRIREVYQNIIENAVKYMGDQPNPIIEIGCRINDIGVTFFVKDNGIGIKPEYHQKIFGLFDKLDPNSDGTGIGLAFVKRIIEFHGGKIWVESDGLNKGATFCFTIDKNYKEA